MFIFDILFNFFCGGVILCGLVTYIFLGSFWCDVARDSFCTCLSTHTHARTFRTLCVTVCINKHQSETLPFCMCYPCHCCSLLWPIRNLTLLPNDFLIQFLCHCWTVCHTSSPQWTQQTRTQTFSDSLCSLNSTANKKTHYLPDSIKDKVERISTFQNKACQGIHLCLGDSEKVKEKYLCSFKWWFWCGKILRLKLPRTSLTIRKSALTPHFTVN